MGKGIAGEGRHTVSERQRVLLMESVGAHFQSSTIGKARRISTVGKTRRHASLTVSATCDRPMKPTRVETERRDEVVLSTYISKRVVER
jgi:hypothetical protein